MKFEDYRRHDAVGLAGLVARSEVSAGELLETAVTRMAEVNPKVNAVTLDMAERAPPGRRQAGTSGRAAGRRPLPAQGPRREAGRRGHKRRIGHVEGRRGQADSAIVRSYKARRAW
ncbi:MAG: hypothetical protein QM753_12865 [Thermomicrobiales bacterium]